MELRPVDRGNGGPGGWIILHEPELHLHGDALVPDLAGWRRERMPQLPDVAAFELAPDWVCEVLSPSTQSHDRVKKMRVYPGESVGRVWLIDPSAQTLEVYRAVNGGWLRSQIAQGREKLRAEPFRSRSSIWRFSGSVEAPMSDEDVTPAAPASTIWRLTSVSGRLGSPRGCTSGPTLDGSERSLEDGLTKTSTPPARLWWAIADFDIVITASAVR